MKVGCLPGATEEFQRTRNWVTFATVGALAGAATEIPMLRDVVAGFGRQPPMRPAMRRVLSIGASPQFAADSAGQRSDRTSWRSILIASGRQQHLAVIVDEVV